MTMTTKQEVENRRFAGKKALIFGNDRARAKELGLEALSLYRTVDAVGSRRAELAHSISALFRDIDELELSEPLAREAVELEAADEGRPWTLGNYLMFLAKLLHARGKAAEALRFAEQGLSVFLREAAPDHSELAFVRADIAAIEADAK